jgi:hypothetical protein
VDNHWVEAQEQAVVLHSKLMDVLEGQPLAMIGSVWTGALTGVLVQSIRTDLATGEAFMEVTLADTRAAATQTAVQQRKDAGVAPDPAGEARLKGVQEERERVRRRYMPVHSAGAALPDPRDAKDSSSRHAVRWVL